MMSDPWKDDAYFAARRTLRNRKCWTGMAEDLLAIVVAKTGEPKDRRSFGHVIKRLHAEGYLQRSGVGRAKTSHRSIKTRWEKAV